MAIFASPRQTKSSIGCGKTNLKHLVRKYYAKPGSRSKVAAARNQRPIESAPIGMWNIPLVAARMQPVRPDSLNTRPNPVLLASVLFPFLRLGSELGSGAVLCLVALGGCNMVRLADDTSHWRFRSGFIEIAGAPSLPRCCALAICRRSSPRLRRHATRPSVSIPAPHPGMERSPRFF